MAIRACGSCNDADFLAQRTLAGVVSFLKIELGLQPDEEVSGDAEAVLGSQGKAGADPFALPDDIAEPGLADGHGFSGRGLADATVGEGVANEGGGRIGDRLGDPEWIARNGGGFRLHFKVISVGVFNSDELDVLHLGILPFEGDSPCGLAGIGIDGVAGASLESVVVEEGHEQEGLFIGFVQDGQPFEGFDRIEIPQFVDFLPVQRLTEKQLLRDDVRKALDHLRENTPKGELGEWKADYLYKPPKNCTSSVFPSCSQAFSGFSPSGRSSQRSWLTGVAGWPGEAGCRNGKWKIRRPQYRRSSIAPVASSGSSAPV